MKLIIVESPTKAKTIQKFLGRGFKFASTYGHLRDLPQKKFGIDVDNNFQPNYVINPRSKKVIAHLKKEAAGAKEIILATDEDREGEAIAWHTLAVMGLQNGKGEKRGPDVLRVTFHEITPRAIRAALQNPRDINMSLVDAQQARRVLDRLVGYKLSPLLWKKIAKRLSAGRVQSVALRLIVEREKEIKGFKPVRYWTITALLASRPKDERFEARLEKIQGRQIKKPGLQMKTVQIEELAAQLKRCDYRVEDVLKKQVLRQPPPPYTTSLLQQDAARRLRFSARQTMFLAQQLYEGVELKKEGQVGLITYMRTDSLNLSGQFLDEAKQFLLENFSEQYAASCPRRFKAKSRLAQEAHEAIRPTSVSRTPQSLKKQLPSKLLRLYEIIWSRALASQMPPARLYSTKIIISASGEGGSWTFVATGQTMDFPGFSRVYPVAIKEQELPELEEEKEVALLRLTPGEHETKPPARYSEATLVKTLEEYGIGRPSTYAPIISTIQERGYVRKREDRRFEPSEIGVLVNDFLTKHFGKVVDYNFTAKMEGDLDKIAHGEKNWPEVIREFYLPFSKLLQQKEKEVKKEEFIETTSEKCPECSSALVVRYSRFGKFLACSGFPKCRYTRSLNPASSQGAQGELNVACPVCQKGRMQQKRTRRGKIFYGCNRYPSCSHATWDRPTGEVCQECSMLIVETRSGKKHCSNEKCSVS